MRKACFMVGMAFFFMMACAPSGQYAIKEVGSFHIGGRQVSLSDLPVREMVSTRGAPPTKVDPNGDYEVTRCMYNT